jgi:release factor glutamine methyltransferase
MSPNTQERAPAGEALGSAVARVQRALAEAAIDDAGREARLLLSIGVGVTSADMIARPERPLTSGETDRLATLLARRLAREPISRMLGEREFYGRVFKLSPETLDPRPDSETLIDAALRMADREGWRTRPVRILDIGTGTGCLLLTLLAELPLATGLGTDVSTDALRTAATNAAALGLAERAHFARHDALAGIDGPFEIVVSNPPYIPSAHIAGLDPEVRLYDPHAALDGGGDGLDVYRRVIFDLPRVLSGWAIFEVGAGQAGSVARLLRQAFVKTRVPELADFRDLGGHTRCVAIRSQI